uniref:Uncharacterized protein n=1 Tax=Oryza punctata TaxID=4537 RepID=A0A0E0JFS0_ORYPU
MLFVFPDKLAAAGAVSLCRSRWATACHAPPRRCTCCCCSRASEAAAAAVSACPSAAGHRRYHSIFNFGDFFADTSNKPVAYAWYSLPSNVMRPPYGETFGHPTGRSSDGRLILNFVAAVRAAGPGADGSFGGGANFAVSGATALDAGFFHDRDIPGAGSKFPLNTSLDVQLSNGSSRSSLCGTAQECSLFFVGEFGVNDYFLFLKKRSVRQAGKPDRFFDHQIDRHVGTETVTLGPVLDHPEHPVVTITWLLHLHAHQHHNPLRFRVTLLNMEQLADAEPAIAQVHQV